MRQVIVDRAIRLAGLREPVHERADEAKLLDAARQLARGLLGLLHRKRRKAAEAIGAPRDLGGEMVVRLAGDCDRALHIVDCLHGWCIERGDHDLHARRIHQAQAFVLKIGEPGPELLPHVRAEHL